MNRMRFSGSSLFGLILIGVGVVSLLSSLGYVDSWEIFSTYWPLILVAFGVKSLIDHKSSTIIGIIVIGLGAFLQLDELGLWYLRGFNVREMIVPTVIILIGLYFIVPKGKNNPTKDEAKVEVKKEVESIIIKKAEPTPTSETIEKVDEMEVVEEVEAIEVVDEVEDTAEDAGFNDSKE